FEGMQQVICGLEPIKDFKKQQQKNNILINPVLNAVADFDGEIKFTYCTEYIVEKNQTEKPVDPLKLRAYLESIGDSVVCVDDETIIKVHVHTNNPGFAIQEGLKFGELVNMKIENMKEQHNNKIIQAKHIKEDEEYVAVDPEKEYGFVAVCAGAGLQAVFADLGVDKVVSGGQTMNPSTDDILRAIQTTPAKTVFVLPNNKNIIMSAEQAVKLADRQVCVLQTRTIPQGISALLAFDETATYSENRLNMTKQFDLVQTGLITFAARNSDFDGHSIKQGEILGLDNGKLSFTEKDLTKAVVRLTKSLTKKSSGNFITVIYGSDVSDEQAEKDSIALNEKFSEDYEVNVINGGQPVYYYIISVE
ncbi:MAG: DAK2 domain-containing protein, partial [Oscillospiraceae bacterium]